MARLAFTTFAIMKAPYGQAEIAGFEALTPAVFRQAENSPGFIARACELDDLHHLTNFERDWGAWGKFTVPRFYDGGFESATDTRASTVSLWQSVEAVAAFAYGGLHQRGLAQRAKWFREPEWPGHAAWWVSDTHIPSWQEACGRLEHLHDQGPTPHAFNLKHAFTPDGELLQLERVVA
jgi:hypothetical protein